MAENKNDIAWKKLFNELKILNAIQKTGSFKISSKQINQHRESRLMTKFNHTTNLPKLLSDNDLSILPISRGEYLIGPFEAYTKLEYQKSLKPKIVNFPKNIQSIDFSNIYSEAAALNCSFVTGIINEIAGEICLPTLSGRMSTSEFDYSIKNKTTSKNFNISVSDSQCEIDGGYECKSSLIIIEAKNYLVDNFLIRQLYYPYRLWENRVKKPVIPVFLTYSNNIFSFFIYEFEQKFHYNSLVLKEQKNFIIAPEKITIEEIKNVLNQTTILPEPRVPFPQADVFLRVMDLLSVLVENDLTLEEITLNYEFDVRQSSYYANAALYLGLVDKLDENGAKYFRLNKRGKKIMKLPFKEKYLEIVKCILQHEVFNKSLHEYFSKAGNITKDDVSDIMKSSSIYSIDKNSSTLNRRAQTVVKWIEWILELTVS